MRTTGLLMLSALCSLSECLLGIGESSKQKPLVRSKRRWVLSTIELQEEDPGPFPRILSQFFHEMAGENHEFHISGHGVDKEPINVFTMDSHTGYVFVHRSVDREQYENTFHLKFDILDKDTKRELDKDLSFDIEVLDINDNAPVFEKPQISIDVKENTSEGYLPKELCVTDRDKAGTNNSKITVSLISQEPKEPKISIMQHYNTRATLILKSGCFDYDKIKKYEVRLKAQDHGKPSLSSTTVITLNILDGNTHPPMFKQKEYQSEVMELYTADDVLRVAVEDKDTPNTPEWYAKYFFIKGNEEGYYKIETDPENNEGIVSVIKGKDYETKSVVTLEVGVKNQEPLWVCKEKNDGGMDKHFYDTAVITIKVKDINDPPVFSPNQVVLHQIEEEKPGKVLFTPKVMDVDSDVSQIKYVLLEDPFKWVDIDKNTGTITSVKSMDRDSPLLNGTGIYTIVIGAIDDGQPSATGTCTVQIQLNDINDNKPQLVNKGVTFCANKNNKVMVAARDADSFPYAGPFFFTLENDEEILKLWKLDPSSGEECGLVSKKALHYGNYSVPLEIRDQQNKLAQETLEVMVCDCIEENVCRSKNNIRVSVGPAGIGVACAGLLFFLLLLLVYVCQCRKTFKHLPVLQEEGNQTLIEYNQEGGLSQCKAEPILLLTPSGSAAVTAGMKKSLWQASQRHPAMMDDVYGYTSSALSSVNHDMNSMGGWHRTGSLNRNGFQSIMSSNVAPLNSQNILWNKNSSYRNGRMLSDQHIASHIDRRLNIIDGMHEDSTVFGPFNYAYEGQGSHCPTLDAISLNTLGDDFTFLNNLGPGFTTLGQICQQNLKQNDVQL